MRVQLYQRTLEPHLLVERGKPGMKMKFTPERCRGKRMLAATYREGIERVG